jgi:hypothetical protein
MTTRPPAAPVGRATPWIDDTDPRAAMCEVMGDGTGSLLVVPMSVSEALLSIEYVEFHFGPDWYQVRHERGQRQPLHRFRQDQHRGDGWSRWRVTGAAQFRRWLNLPAIFVPIEESERDPLTRWGTIPTHPDDPRRP